MNSWVSTGLKKDASNFLLAKLRAQRVPDERSKRAGACSSPTTRGTLAAMPAAPAETLSRPLFVAPEYQGRNIGRRLLAFTRARLPDEICCAACARNEKAWRWYEREGFVFEKEQVETDDRVRR